MTARGKGWISAARPARQVRTFVMEFRILGPLEAVEEGRVVSLGGSKKRATLAILLLHHDRVISSDRLIAELWGNRPPATGPQSLRVHISQIRKALGSDVVRTAPTGYVLELEPDQLDASRFERLSREGTEAIAAGDAGTAAALLRQALDLWRGPALVDFTYEPFAQAEIARLEELRLAAVEARIDADLALGGRAELIAELEVLVADNPFRERIRAQLMLALYRAGRQSEALAAYRHARRTFIDELGLEPTVELRDLEREILAQAPSLDLGPGIRHRSPELPAVRKTLTVLHVEFDPGGGTPVDPEALARRFVVPLGHGVDAVARHEGTVLAQTEAALTAAFGLPSLHEDDALRAIRTAVDLRKQLIGRDDLQTRIGIATGEVMTSGSAALVGAVAGSCARLAHAAPPGEIVVDAATWSLAANAVEVEPLEGVIAFRVDALRAGVPAVARRLEAPLIGRRAELAELVAAVRSTIAARAPALLVVAGPPGIGKSRLAMALAADVANQATALFGRCLSYGQGITLWPLREMVREAAGDDTREALGALLRGQDDGAIVADSIAAAFGHVDIDRSTEETLAAFRRLFETLAGSRPHVLVVEDVQWAEPALLDLLEYVSRARGVPLLILCLARPEFFDTRPAWSARAIHLGALSSVETGTLIDNLPRRANLARDVRDRVVGDAEGNPLFAEQFALLAVDGTGAIGSVAPTIHAILAARLDRLGPDERAVAERAAVVGREFTLGAVADLLPAVAASSARRHLDTLMRQQLMQADHAVLLPGGPGFRFQHALVHDAAYRRVPKALRAELHERLAGWLEGQTGTRITELEEIVGHHLERAVHYRIELGDDEAGVQELAGRAAARLAAAGRRAFERTDFGATDSLVTRALELLPPEDPATVELLNLLAYALGPRGAIERQSEVLAEAVRRATRLGDRTGEWHARLERRWTDVSRGGSLTDAHRDAERALRVFEQAGDAIGMARASGMIASAQRLRGEGREATITSERAVANARRSGASVSSRFAPQWELASALLAGPTPVPAAIARCEELLGDAPESLVLTTGVTWVLGVLRAMNGDFETARDLVDRAASICETRSISRPLVIIALAAGRIEVLAGEPALAERRYRGGLELAGELGERRNGDAIRVRLAEALCLMGRTQEAAEQLHATAGPDNSAVNSARWRFTRARVLALQGDATDAEARAREAIAGLAATDLLDVQGDAALALALVLAAAGDRAEESADALDQAVHFYERKGGIAAVGLARSLLPADRSA